MDELGSRSGADGAAEFGDALGDVPLAPVVRAVRELLPQRVGLLVSLCEECLGLRERFRLLLQDLNEGLRVLLVLRLVPLQLV